MTQTRAAPSITLLEYAFARAGCHPDVDLVVSSVELLGRAIHVAIELRYDASRPICCAEPACYVPALRPDGLAAIRKHVQAEELLDEPPALTVTATLSLGPGFRFREAALGATDRVSITYRHPEP